MHRWSSRQGFTLIELMVVIAIIGVLTAILFPVFSRVREKARQTRCQHQMMQLVTELNQYHRNNGHYPPAPSYDDVTDPSNPRYKGGFSDLYPDYIEDRSLFICPDDRDAMRFAEWCRDAVYCSYNGIIDWTDSAPPSEHPDDPTFQDILYNYYGYTFCCQIDENGDEVCDCSSLPGSSSGYDVGFPGITLALIRPGESLDWMDTDTNGIPDWLDQAGLSWRHFPALRNNNPPDTTIVTHCYHHRRYFGGSAEERDIIVRLSGETSLVNVTDMGNPDATGVAGVAGWVHQNF